MESLNSEATHHDMPTGGPAVGEAGEDGEGGGAGQVPPGEGGRGQQQQQQQGQGRRQQQDGNGQGGRNLCTTLAAHDLYY